MCHFITIVIPPKSDLDAIREVFQSYDRKLIPLSNPSIIDRLGDGEQYFQAQKKICDCGTALGSANHQRDLGRVDKKELDNLRRKGWGDSKINRWLEQKKAVDEREKRIRNLRSLERGGDPDGWCAITRKTFDEAKIQYCGLLLHWYARGLDSENFKKFERKVVSHNSNLADELYHMQEDVLYLISK